MRVEICGGQFPAASYASDVDECFYCGGESAETCWCSDECCAADGNEALCGFDVPFVIRGIRLMPSLTHLWCKTCGAAPGNSDKRRAGKLQSACPTCGASKSRWRWRVEVDRELPVSIHGKRAHGSAVKTSEQIEAEYGGKMLSTAERRALEDAWQRAYDKRREADNRLGLRRDDDYDTRHPENRGRLIDEARAKGATWHPMDELLAAARAGDEDAMERCDELYHWRDEARRTG